MRRFLHAYGCSRSRIAHATWLWGLCRRAALLQRLRLQDRLRLAAQCYPEVHRLRPGVVKALRDARDQELQFRGAVTHGSDTPELSAEVVALGIRVSAPGSLRARRL